MSCAALAAAKLGRQAPNETLQPTALVHEAWLRLGGDQQPAWQNRAHFFGAAAEAMRRVILDRIRGKNRQKRGGDRARIDLDEVRLATEDPDDTVLAVNEALERLASIAPEKAEVVRLRGRVSRGAGAAASTAGRAEDHQAGDGHPERHSAV